MAKGYTLEQAARVVNSAKSNNRLSYLREARTTPTNFSSNTSLINHVSNNCYFTSYI
jgi:hypothetical protein